MGGWVAGVWAWAAGDVCGTVAGGLPRGVVVDEGGLPRGRGVADEGGLPRGRGVADEGFIGAVVVGRGVVGPV